MARPVVKVVGMVTAPKTFPILYWSSAVTKVLHGYVAALAREHEILVAFWMAQ